MSFPVADWQFWVATLLVIAGLIFFARTLLPKRTKRKRASLTISAPSKRKPRPRRRV